MALDELIPTQQAFTDDVDTTAFAEADRAFHCAIVAAADNDIVTGLYEALRDRQLRMSVLHVAHSPERLQVAVAEHGVIADALNAGDPIRAGAGVRLHLANTAVSLGLPGKGLVLAVQPGSLAVRSGRG